MSPRADAFPADATSGFQAVNQLIELVREGFRLSLKSLPPSGRKFTGADAEAMLYTWDMNRITLDPEQCGGRPCIRGMRIRVVDVLDLLANGLTPSQVLEELPDLEAEDIQACLQYASRKLNHPVLVAA